MEIDFGKLPFDLDFHPSRNLVAAGLITGELLVYRYYAESTPERLLNVNAHTESCRTLRFVNEGRAIVTGSPDGSIIATDVETGTAVARLENCHDGAAVNRIVNLTESTIASGDDDGCIKVWDTRQQSSSNSFNVHTDYISDMTFTSDSMKLIATSGDGTLSVCNLRSNKVQTQSEFSEDEPLSVVIMKNGRKVVCGTQSGTLLLYSWGFFKDCSDRFVDLSPNSVDALLKAIDPETHAVVVDSPAMWEEYGRTNSKYLQLKGKTFPYYDSWCELFGQFRAIGTGARDHGDAEREPSPNPSTFYELIDDYEEGIDDSTVGDREEKASPVIDGSASGSRGKSKKTLPTSQSSLFV